MEHCPGQAGYKEATPILRPSMSPPDRQIPPQPVVLPPIVTTPRARQGVTGHNVRHVLGFRLAATIVAFIVVYLLYFG
jgi:hypothetical protein